MKFRNKIFWAYHYLGEQSIAVKIFWKTLTTTELQGRKKSRNMTTPRPYIYVVSCRICDLVLKRGGDRCHGCWIASNVIEYEIHTRWGTSVPRRVSSMHLHVYIVHFLKLMSGMVKNVPLERWNQLVIGCFKTMNLAWVNKIVVIDYTWL